MKRPAFKSNRINEEIRRNLAEILREVKDPRLPSMLSIVSVDVSKDVKSAKVHLSYFGDCNEKECLKILNSAKGFIRKQLGDKISFRNTPELFFVLDNSIRYGAHINEIIKGFSKTESTPDGEDDDE